MTDKISMIELFSGVGAQERGLRQLGLPYEIVNTCDCDANAVLSYAAMRWDLEKEMETFEFPSQDKMIEELQAKNLGYDFQKGKHSITKRTPIDKLKQYYIADKLSSNLGDISKVDKLPYADVVTYSFPCTDLSVAGKGEGMVNKCNSCGHSWPIDFSNAEEALICPNCGATVSSSTRSGLLGQVQRLLATAYKDNELPRILVMENVKNLVGKKFKPQFDAWLQYLDSIGYNTYWKVLNAKNYGVSQNRERIFAISIRKDIDTNGFTFPEPIPLTTRLKDILEYNVDEKYYLPDDRIEKILNSSFMQEKKRIQTTDVCDTLLARDWKDPKCVPIEEDVNPIRIGNIYDENYGTGYAGNVWDKEGISPTLQTAQGGNRMPLIVEDEIKVVGNYMPSNHDASRVVDVDGIAPTVKENHGTVTTIAEPFIVASRGRNPENPSDRTTGIKTEQRFEPNKEGICNCLTSVQKDAYVVEPQVLRAERTEYGKAIRKQYEAGEVDEKIGNMRIRVPRIDGISNTITTVLQDNYVAEPQAINKPRVYPGARFGRLVAKRDTGEKQGTNHIWECECDCGNTCYVNTGRLGITTNSCGCLKIDSHRTHNMSNTRLYRIWCLMKGRCFNKNLPNYENYGARGITVCDEWLKFENFYEWAINNGYREDLTIERKNNDGNYEPSNCKWADLTTQVNNRRNWGEVEYYGIVKDNTGYRAQVTVNGKKIYIAHSTDDIEYLINERNKYIDEHNLPNKKNIFKKLEDVELEPIIYDDYNSHIPQDQDTITIPITNCEASAERNGATIDEKVAIVEDQFPGSRDARIYKEYSPTLRQNCGGLQVAKGEDNLEPQLEFVGGIGDKDWAKDGKQLSRNYPQGSRVYSSDGIASALTAQGVGGAGGFSGLYAVDEEQPQIRWRIRKLTPVECWRLMNFTDQDCNRAAKYVSASALYKQAGNSIVVACLIAIFSSLFAEDGYKSDIWTKYSINYDD